MGLSQMYSGIGSLGLVGHKVGYQVLKKKT